MNSFEQLFYNFMLENDDYDRALLDRALTAKRTGAQRVLSPTDFKKAFDRVARSEREVKFKDAARTARASLLQKAKNPVSASSEAPSISHHTASSNIELPSTAGENPKLPSTDTVHKTIPKSPSMPPAKIKGTASAGMRMDPVSLISQEPKKGPITTITARTKAKEKEQSAMDAATFSSDDMSKILANVQADVLKKKKL